MDAYPQVEIDTTRCTTPFDCKRCLQICPQAVFYVLAIKVQRFVETDKKEPGSFVIFPIYRDRCTLCGDCIRTCPVAAITLQPPHTRRGGQPGDPSGLERR